MATSTHKTHLNIALLTYIIIHSLTYLFTYFQSTDAGLLLNTAVFFTLRTVAQKRWYRQTLIGSVRILQQRERKLSAEINRSHKSQNYA